MKNLIRYALIVSTLCAACAWLVDAWGAERPHIMNDYLVYIGTYNGPKSQGIYVYRLSLATGKLAPLGLAAASDRPAFLALHPNHKYLYAVNEINQYDGKKSGSVSAFSIDHATGKLTLLNIVPSGDPGPCHLTVDHTGKYLLVANYGVGSVASFPILADGRLGKVVSFIPHIGHSVDPKRQEAPHAHSIYISADNRFVVSADLGTDQVCVYRFDANTGTLTPNQPPYASVPPGTGPRHFAFDPNGKFAYVIEEMGSSLTAFTWDAAHGVLHPFETIKTVPKDYTGYNDCAELYFRPDGKFLYGSNRGYDGVTVFAIDPVKGTPTPVQYVHSEGKTPRSFGIDPTGSYLIAANQDSDSLVVLHIDPSTGHLTPTGQKEEVGSPICVVFEAGK